MFNDFRHGRISLEEVEINFFSKGDGPPLLLLHGFPQNLYMWARVASILAMQYTVVCADLRGYGDSVVKPLVDPDGDAHDPQRASFRAMATDQLQLMRSLGFDEFHVVGHDRGGRTAHRMALDHPGSVLSLSVLDIVPTHAMFDRVDRNVARAYWHWYFLQQPAPYPETVILANPDHFFEGCLVGWGATGLADFDMEQLEAYRRAWRRSEVISGFCHDYRAAASVDFDHDAADLARKVECPTLAFWGSAGLMHQLFDMRQLWAARCERLSTATLPGGHFFVDQFPSETAELIDRFVSDVRAQSTVPIYLMDKSSRGNVGESPASGNDV